MNKVFGTHLHVLASTYPELKHALEQLIQEEVTSDSLQKYERSPMYSTIISDMAITISKYASNYHKINIILTRLNTLIDTVGEVNYEHLSDLQKAELPELAGEVDKINNHIREEIYPVTIGDKQQVLDTLHDLSDKGLRYIDHVYSQMVSQMSQISSEVGVDISLDEGKTIVSQQDLDNWLDRNSQVNQGLISKLMKDRENVEGFCKVILALEALIYIDRVDPETKNRHMKKAIKLISKATLDGINFDEIPPAEGGFVRQLDEYDERSQKIEEIFSGYPLGEESLDPSAIKDLDRLSKPTDLFTSVDGDET